MSYSLLQPAGFYAKSSDLIAYIDAIVIFTGCHHFIQKALHPLVNNIPTSQIWEGVVQAMGRMLRQKDPQSRTEIPD